MQKFRWYLNRLRVMSAAEMLYRAKKKFVGTPPLNILDGEQLATSLSVGRIAGASGDLAIGDWAVGYIQYADDRLSKRYDIFELKNVEIRQFDWQKDYGTGKRAELLPTDKLDYRDYERIGNIKYIWELSRHQFLIPVAIAYYLTGKDKYKDYIIDVIEHWIDNNPYRMGINWSSCLELAVRLISWFFVTSFLGGRSATLPDQFRRKLAESVYTHAFHIHHNPSLFSSANNHLVGELTGLICAAVMLRGYGDISRWKDQAKRWLVVQAERQVLTDGVGAEQAPSYQAHTVGYYILGSYFLRQLEEDVPKEYLDLVSRSAEFYEALMDCRGGVPSIGDDDGGVPIFVYCDPAFNVYRSIINTGVLLTGDGAPLPYPLDEVSFWLFSDLVQRGSKSEGQGKGASAKVEVKRSFRDGGYYVLGDHFGEEDEVKLVFDCAPLGFLGIAAHGHADALSFNLTYKGTRFLIDPGTYKYFIAPRLRDYFRSTAAHNTIRIDGLDQSEMAGPFLWGHKAESVLYSFSAGEERDEVDGEHNGYCRLRQPVRHRRKLTYIKLEKRFQIEDSLTMRGSHNVEVYFHVDKRCRVERIDDYNFRLMGASGDQIALRVDDTLDWRVVNGQQNPMLGWQSEAFGEISQTSTLVGSKRLEGDQRLSSEITLQ